MPDFETLSMLPHEQAAVVALATMARDSDGNEASVRSIAQTALELVASLSTAPSSEGRSDESWLAMRQPGQLSVFGETVAIVSTANDDTRARKVRLSTDEVGWLIDSTEAIPGAAMVRVRVSKEGDVVADWSFEHGHPARNNTDYQTHFRAGLDELASIKRDSSAIDDQGPVTEAAPIPPRGVKQPPVAQPVVTPAPAPTPTPLSAPVAAREPWRPTHRVGQYPLQVGGVPRGPYDPSTRLDPGLEVRLIEQTQNGWALVECSNGWRCYVNAAGLIPNGTHVAPTAFRFYVEAPVWLQTSAGARVQELVPGTWYEGLEERQGWVHARVAAGAEGWVPVPAIRRG